MTSSDAPILELKGISKSFKSKTSIADRLTGRGARVLRAVRDVSLTLHTGETLGIVGESGCGKSTLGRCITGFYEPDEGQVLYAGRPFLETGTRLERSRAIQMIFQDPYSSLNPRMTLAQALDEVLLVHGLRKSAGERSDRVDELMLTVGLSPDLKYRLPHALSGGQRQRFSIARALAVEPRVLVADEPVSALDASAQAQIINLFVDLRERFGLAYIFVAHDLNVVRYVSQRIGVMYLGQVVELADADAMFERPGHPYTRALLSAIPEANPEHRRESASIEGDPPDPLSPPPGCSFSTRCPMAIEICRNTAPLAQLIAGHAVCCHRGDEVAAMSESVRKRLAPMSSTVQVYPGAAVIRD